MWSICDLRLFFFFFFKQKTAYEMRISDWSSDVCSSDLEFTDTSGQIRLFTESGRSLVSGTSVSALSYTTTPYMTANETYPGSISGITLNGATNDITADLTTGKLGEIGRAS